jgi:hypothetical protein
MTNGNDVTNHTKHTILFNKKNLLRTLFLQPTRQQECTSNFCEKRNLLEEEQLFTSRSTKWRLVDGGVGSGGGDGVPSFREIVGSIGYRSVRTVAWNSGWLL